MRNEESNAMLPAEVVEDGDGVFESDTMVSSFSDSELKPVADKNVRVKITRLLAADFAILYAWTERPLQLDCKNSFVSCGISWLID